MNHYQTSYESGLAPFQPDIKRGIWSRPHDLFYAGLSLAFRLDIFSISSYFVTYHVSQVVSSIPCYILLLLFYIIPLQVMQMYLGQFSSSGFISAFRISPIFKGVGYLSLILNIGVLCYFSIFATVPLVYLLASLNPTLPWSCEGYESWGHLINENDKINLCDMKIPNVTQFMEEEETITTTTTYNSTEYGDDFNDTFVSHSIPSVMYFTLDKPQLGDGLNYNCSCTLCCFQFPLRFMFKDDTFFTKEEFDFDMSWKLIMATVFIWLLVALIYYKSQTIELYGCMVRYGMWILLLLLTLCLIRFSFLEDAGTIYRQAFTTIDWSTLLDGLMMAPIYTITAFGPGWGVLISLASHNTFKTNVFRYSWYIGLGQIFILVALNVVAMLTEHYFHVITQGNYYSPFDHQWTLYLSTGSAMATMSWANLWCVLYYFMLILAAFMLIVLQVYSILTSIFDEFHFLRERKLEVGLAFILGVSICSLYFASNEGVLYFSALTSDAATIQICLNLLLILMICWVYGRVRFQDDLKFMVGKHLATFRIHILRFLVPLCFLLIMLLYVVVSLFEHTINSSVGTLLAILMILVPWIFIPGFMAYSMWRVTGDSLRIRFAKCCRPTDWYPVGSQHRQAYEEAMGNQDITHQLEEVADDQHVA